MATDKKLSGAGLRGQVAGQTALCTVGTQGSGLNYRGYDVWELPPNGQGIAALQILNILEQFDVASMGHDSPEYVHLFTEAKKIVFEVNILFYNELNPNLMPFD